MACAWRPLADKPLPLHTKVGFVVAVLGVLLGCFVGYLFGPMAGVAVGSKGLIASFVASIGVGLLTADHRDR